MSSLDSLLMKQTAKKGVVVQRLLDKSIGVRIRSKENGGGVAITVTQATKVRLTSTTGGNDDYTWGVAGIDTVGALVDAINADGMFEAVVIDALRSENPDDFFIDGAAVTTTDENGVVCYDLLVDNSVALTWAVCLSPLKPNFDMPAGHRVHLQQVDYDVDNTPSTGTLKIYRRSKSGTETLIYSATNADGSDTSLTWASGEGYISGSIDEDLVVFFDGTVVDANSTYIRLIGIYE